MKVLMFGWEFPPFNSGGLGVACQNLVKALAKQGVQVTFVLPKKMNIKSSFCDIVFADSSIKTISVNSILSPYLTSKSYHQSFNQIKKNNIYSPNLVGEVLRYGKAAEEIALNESFDIIHAHDWLSFPAAISAKKVSKKPYVAHVHATEFDRTGGTGVNENVFEIEREGFINADAVLAVSNYTRNKIRENYCIDGNKVYTVHNAINYEDYDTQAVKDFFLKTKGQKIVLYVGRITIQKGPDYFIQAAKKVLEKMKDVIFVVAGTGDMEGRMIELAACYNISDKILFAGFLRDNDLARIYKIADLYVMPSVSEPFGLTPLESMVYGTPVLISYQSGVSEVIKHALKVDFWDINEMANKIVATLQYQELHDELKSNGSSEVKYLNWNNAAAKCINVYQKLIT